MRHARSRIVLLLIAVWSTPAIVGAAPPPHRNAATRYERAFEHLETLSDADWEIVYDYYSNPAGPKPPGLGRIRSRVTRTIDAAVRGSKLPTADYQLDWDQGYAMLLPHLAPMRQIIKLMRHDVMVRLQEGDTWGATERLAAMYRMSRHPTDDGTMISSLVGMAMYDLADQTLDIAIAQGMLGDREYGALLDATETVSGDDPFRMQYAVAGERDLGGDWLRRFSNEEERVELIESFGWMDDSQIDVLSTMSEQDYLAQLDVYDATLTRIEGAFANPDRDEGRATLAEVEAQIESGELGPVVGMLLPAVSRAFERSIEVETRIAGRRRQLQELAAGRRDPRELVNAAFLYQRAAEAITQFEPDVLAALRAYARGEEADDDLVRGGLAEAAPILDLLDEASRYERCDFSAVRPHWAENRLFATPIVGMADAGALLIAAALAPPHEGNAARDPVSGPARDPALQLATCLRMAGHLAGDDALLSALVAHVLFERTVELADRGDRAKTPALLEAAARLRPGDPFGYRRGLATAQAAVYRWTSQRVTPPPPPTVAKPTTTQPAESPETAAAAEAETQRIANFWAKLEAKVATLDGDELFCLMAIIEHGAVVDPPIAFAWGLRPFPGDPLPPLEGVIDRARYTLITGRAAAIEAIVAADAIALLFGAEPAPKAARVVERTGRAAADLRKGRARLRELAGTPATDAAPPAPAGPE